MFSKRGDLSDWEEAFLGKRSLLSTWLFWQSLVAFLSYASFAFLFAMNLKARRPALVPYLIPVVAILSGWALFNSFDFVRKAVRMKRLLCKYEGEPEYSHHADSVRALALRFFRLTIGLGVVMAIALTILEA